MGRFSRLMGADTPFDPSNRFQTSALISPRALSSVRLVVSLYIFTVLIYRLIYSGVNDGGHEAKTSFSYFTNMTYWSMGFYFLFAGMHGAVYARKGVAPLQKWPKVLQAMHTLHYTTIITFPFLVTVVYWGILAPDASPFTTVYNTWSQISVHALNSLFAIFEIFIPRTNPPPWLHLPFLIAFLCGYLGSAYLTYATQKFYTYSFLDPAEAGSGRVVAYVFGILLAITAVFLIVKGSVWARGRAFGEKRRGGGGGGGEEDEESLPMRMKSGKVGEGEVETV